MASLDFEAERNAFREYYSSNVHLLQAAENSFRTLVSALLASSESFAPPTVTSRLKSREECISKFILKYQSSLEKEQTPYEIKDHITDLIGLRVTCYYETDVLPIREILIQNFDVIDITDKTSKLESRDDVFGYKGLHLDLRLNQARREMLEYKSFEPLRFEIQIRTIIQHAWSELDHKIKYKKSPPQGLRRKINRLAALFELADQEFVNIRLDIEKRELLATTHSQQDILHLPSTPSNTADLITSKDIYLDAFQFLSLGKELFPNYDFTSDKIDGFVEEICKLAPAFTKNQLQEAFAKHLGIIEEYADYQAQRTFNLNPFTMIRHALYLYDKSTFSSMLFNMQKANFEKWLRQTHPNNET